MPQGCGHACCCLGGVQKRPAPAALPADPAADEFKYPVAIDVRDLISLSDAMEEMELGPNG